MTTLNEDGVPANNMGSGAIEGAGVDKPGKPGSGEPGVRRGKNKKPVMTKEPMTRSSLMSFKNFIKSPKS